ncbi:amidohydrolase [Pueribacillus sp. YX66]|uniref:amidohydrolase n=1 Tax=Pueribacillus sp. YX66 TaxID=3229242 RepID=UPI00358CF9CA
MYNHKLADTVVKNVNVLTMEPRQPVAKGIAIADGKIIALLTDKQQDVPLSKSGIIIDGANRTVMPGLIDAHLHLKGVLSQYVSLSCDATNVTSIADIIQLIHKKAMTLPPNQWIRAMNYDTFYLREQRHPTRWDLDQASTKHPIRLRHVTRHVSVLNSLALNMAGISKHSSEPANVTVDRDPITNEPTGIIYGGDAWLSSTVIPPLSQTEIKQSISKLQTDLLKYGIVAVYDASPTNDVSDVFLWTKIINDDWPITVQLMTNIENYHSIKQQLNEQPTVIKDGRLSLGHVKVVIESANGLNPNLDQLTEIAITCCKHHIPLAIHVVEPEMIAVAIEAIKQAEKQTNVQLSHRFEHLSLCPDTFLKDIQRLQIDVVTNPSLIYDHGNRYVQDVEKVFHKWLYRMRTVKNHGITLAAGSDAPVATINPWKSMYTATSRKTRKGQYINKNEALTRQQMIQLFTTNAAKVSNWAHIRGKIAVGYNADFIVLNHNPLTCSLNQLKTLTAQQTWIDGKIVYEKNKLI